MRARPNQVTGANAGRPRPLPVWTRWTARAAQFDRSAASHILRHAPN